MKQLKLNPKIKKYFKWVMNIAIIIIMVLLFDNMALIGFAIIILLFGLWRCWVYRVNIMAAMRTLESMIWGKPLDRDVWDKHEMRDTKVKIVWGKKNE